MTLTIQSTPHCSETSLKISISLCRSRVQFTMELPAHGPPPTVRNIKLIMFLIPADWATTCTSSRVLEDFDLGNQAVDHSAVAIELAWTQTSSVKNTRHTPINDFDRTKLQGNMKHQMERGIVAPWETDVETHLNQINSDLRQQMRKFCPKRKIGPSRPYVTDELWQLGKSKLWRRTQLKTCSALLRRETLCRIFQAWSGQADVRFDETSGTAPLSGWAFSNMG